MRHQKCCTVLRPAGFPDCTGNGITARNDTVTVVKDVPYGKSVREPTALAVG